ncbi:MAG: hypothetical protein HQL64_16485 [Magnetococcales bacterium]|nr:hypothetical protein [Magnetococcales bacterium]
MMKASPVDTGMVPEKISGRAPRSRSSSGLALAGCFRLTLPCILLACVLSGCGYRFSEANPDLTPAWRHTRIRVEGPGAKSDPLLAGALRLNLEKRLGVASSGESAGGEQRELVVRLEAVERSMHLGDRSGLADQYQIMLRAQPHLTVNGTAVKPGYPQVKGVVVYNELRTVTASQAARDQATTEAANQLTEELVALLVTQF